MRFVGRIDPAVFHPLRRRLAHSRTGRVARGNRPVRGSRRAGRLRARCRDAAAQGGGRPAAAGGRGCRAESGAYAKGCRPDRRRGARPRGARRNDRAHRPGRRGAGRDRDPAAVIGKRTGVRPGDAERRDDGRIRPRPTRFRAQAIRYPGHAGGRGGSRGGGAGGRRKGCCSARCSRIPWPRWRRSPGARG